MDTMKRARNIGALAWAITLSLAACDGRPVAFDPVILDPCGQVADVALQKQLLPLVVAGGMNEKIDPKVMPAGGLVNITDAYRAKSGELRARTGWTQMTNVSDTGASLSSCRALVPLQGGNIGLIASLAPPGTADALYVYSPTKNRWMHNTRGYQPMPMAVTTLSQIESRGMSGVSLGVGTPDYAVAGSMSMTSIVDFSGTGPVGYILSDTTKNVQIKGLTTTGFSGTLNRVAAGGTSYLAVFVTDATGTLKALVVNVATLAVNTYVLTGAVLSSLALDAVSKPGGNNILIAASVSAGGAMLIEFDPSTGAIVTGPTTIVTGNSVKAAAWLQDRFATGFYHLGVIDSINGVLVKKLTTAFVVSATTVVDAAATTSSSITGYLTASTPTYNVITQASVGINTNATSLVRGLVLVSKTFAIGTKYYFLASYQQNVSVQPTAFVVAADQTTQDISGSRLAGIIMPGTFGGQVTNSLASVVVAGSSAIAALMRVTKQAKSVYSTADQVVLATINFTPKLRNARELSGTTFLPGGMVTQFDGSMIDLATFPLFPEVTQITTAVGGAMTASGVYQYVTVYRSIDASGRIKRSAPSIPFPVTLGAGDHSAQVSSLTARIGTLVGVTDPVVEFYRAGPAAAGGIVYNKVGEVQSVVTVDNVTFNDTIADTVAASGELLYDPLANSGVLNNFPSPSTQILEVLDNRVFVVSAENPTEVWASKEYKTGAGLAFNPGIVQRFTGGPVTALAAMDGRLVVFQQNTTWVWPIGPGPNDQGQGAFGDPQLVSLNLGCVDPNSVIATPDGIMFQSAKGIYLLTRGLDMQPIGDAVEDGLSAILLDGDGIAGASLAVGLNQVRFMGNDSRDQTSPTRTLVYDYNFKQWYEWNLPTQDATVVGAATSGGISYYAEGSGAAVWQETAQAGDAGGTAVPWSFKLPHLALGQLGGWALTYELQVIGSYVGPHAIAVSLQPSYGALPTMTGTRTIASAPASYQYAFRPKRQKATSMQPLVTVTPTGAAEGARISALSLVYGAKGGRFPMAANRRLG
jgi:hypothetical protein